MELRLSNSSHNCVLWLCSFALCAIIGMCPVASIEVYTPTEVYVENGTTGVLKCTFKSNQVISSQASVSWSYIPEGSSDSVGEYIFYYAGGKGFPDSIQFKSRVEWAGDLNKKDGSIRISKMQFSDNGTYACDVKNPPDIAGKSSLTKLRVVQKASLDTFGMNWNADCIPGLSTNAHSPQMSTDPQSHPPKPSGKPPQKNGGYYNSKGGLTLERDVQKAHIDVIVKCPQTFESLPQTSPAVIVGAVIGAIIGVIIIAVVAYLLIRVMRSTRNCEGCTSIEVSTQAARPGKKAESSTDGSRCSSPSAPVQGPVIYAQLDHSGSKNSFHKMEPVVYADIRKN